jgi:hypothetical protein
MELVMEELREAPEPVPRRVLAFTRRLKSGEADAMATAVASEEVLARDWLTPEEDAAWADL